MKLHVNGVERELEVDPELADITTRDGPSSPAISSSLGLP